MTPAELRLAMQRYRQQIEAEANALKDPYLALDRLRGEFSKLDVDERRVANEVLGEWALSDDEGLRYDALALIEDLNVRTALPALEKLMRRLAESASPGAPYELKKVRRIAAKLEEDQARG